MNKRIVSITTIDNPFDPIDDFDNWLQFDIEKGYYTCSYLSRIAKTSDLLTDYEYMLEIERAIDEIIELDFMKMYKKVVKET